MNAIVSAKQILTIGAELEQYRQAASDRLESEKGRRYRSKRPVDVEAVFGRLKQNWGFRRFILRGLENLSTEWGILSVAHNIAKVCSCIATFILLFFKSKGAKRLPFWDIFFVVQK